MIPVHFRPVIANRPTDGGGAELLVEVDFAPGILLGETDGFVSRTPLSPIRDLGAEVISYFPIQDGLTAAASKPTMAIVLREVFCSAPGTFSASVGGGDRGSGGEQSSGLLRVTRG